MKISGLWTELREAITLPTKGSLVKAILFLVGILILAIGFSILLSYLFPSEEEFKAEFIPKYGKYAYPVIFLICLLSSFTIVLPAPGVALVLAMVANPDLNLNPALAGFSGSVGGALGEITAYYAGYLGRAVIAPRYKEEFKRAEEWMERYGGITIFLFALFPFLIFDLAGIAAGALKYPVKKFLLYCWMGRLPRHIIECYFGATLLKLLLLHLPEWIRAPFWG